MAIIQEKAIELVREILGHFSKDEAMCSGDIETCPTEECYVCGIRDCPGNEPLHYHHDGCPYCYFHQK